MRRRWLILLVGTLFLTSPRPALACSCVQFTKTQLVENASVIFTGTVTGFSRTFGFAPGCTVSSADPITVAFDVDAVFKGDVTKAASVTTVVGGASCGYEFVGGKRYTVFATGASGKLETNLCRSNVEGAIVASDYGLAGGRPPTR